MDVVVVVVVLVYFVVDLSQTSVPLVTSKQYLSNDDCLEDKREDCQTCSVLCCV